MGELSSRLCGRCDCPAADAAPSTEHGGHRPFLLALDTSVPYSQLGSFSNLICGIKGTWRKKYLHLPGDNTGFLTSIVWYQVFNMGVKLPAGSCAAQKRCLTLC